jgi:hypothetical protein
MPHMIAQSQDMEFWLLAHWWDIVRIVDSRYIDRYISWAIRPRRDSATMNHKKISLQFCDHLQLYLHVSISPWLQKQVRLIERFRLQICRIFHCYRFVTEFRHFEAELLTFELSRDQPHLDWTEVTVPPPQRTADRLQIFFSRPKSANVQSYF